MSATESAPPVVEVPVVPEAAARSRLYALLAEAFAYPQGAAVLRLLDGDWMADVLDALDAAPHPIPAPPALATPDSPNAVAEMQVIYTDLFDVTSGTPRVSLLERRYGDNPEQKLWQDLLGFYRHFGLDFSRGYAQEQPDHLLTELGFMHYLAFLEAGTPLAANRASLRRGQRDFLQLHLGAWAGEFAHKLEPGDIEHPYVIPGRLLADVIEADLRFLAGDPTD